MEPGLAGVDSLSQTAYLMSTQAQAIISALACTHIVAESSGCSGQIWTVAFYVQHPVLFEHTITCSSPMSSTDPQAGSLDFTTPSRKGPHSEARRWWGASKGDRLPAIRKSWCMATRAFLRYWGVSMYCRMRARNAAPAPTSPALNSPRISSHSVYCMRWREWFQSGSCNCTCQSSSLTIKHG